MTEYSVGDAADRETRDGATPGAPFVGEALRLVSSMQDWAQGWAHGAGHETSDPHAETECQWCPLCQLVAALRGQRPALTDRVAEAGTALVAALRLLVEAAAGHEGQPHSTSRPPGPRVQKINLGDES